MLLNFVSGLVKFWFHFRKICVLKHWGGEWFYRLYKLWTKPFPGQKVRCYSKLEREVKSFQYKLLGYVFTLTDGSQSCFFYLFCFWRNELCYTEYSSLASMLLDHKSFWGEEKVTHTHTHTHSLKEQNHIHIKYCSFTLKNRFKFVNLSFDAVFLLFWCMLLQQ